MFRISARRHREPRLVLEPVVLATERAEVALTRRPGRVPDAVIEIAPLRRPEATRERTRGIAHPGEVDQGLPGR
jgi:hypothetical protein